MRRPRLPRPSMVMLPNGFTLMNLFFGVFAIVTASRGGYERAVWYIHLPVRFATRSMDVLSSRDRHGKPLR